MKVLSIIVPTYNMEKYLERCLSSLIVDVENMRKIEVLVINDGSTDGSSAIARRFMEQYPDTFVVIDKENGHYGSCVNRGLSIATGKYVKILDADDWFNTEELNKFIQFLSDIEVDVVFSRYVMYIGGKQWQSSEFNSPERKEILIRDLPESYYDNTHHSLTYRTVFLKSFNYSQTEGIPYTDVEWCLYPMARVSYFSYFPGVLYYYDREREGQSMAPNVQIKNLGVNCDIVLKTIDYYENIKDTVPNSNRKIMLAISTSQAKYLYECLLIKYGKQVSDDFVELFDTKLLSISPEIYYSVELVFDNRKFGTLYYVRQWRKHRTRKSLAFAYYDFGIKLGSFWASINK